MINHSPPPRNGNGSKVDPDLLLAQSSWVETLARALVRDPFGAEDVYQETMLAALESPPRDATDAKRLRAWLGRVAYNLAHLSMRRTRRRRAREEWAAKPSVAGSTADRVARSSVLSQVVETVHELEEPYRTAVLKRYFEGKSTVQIASETETTDNAVRKRLWRARAKLRTTLDRAHNGDRLAWFGALAPLAGIELPTLPPSGPPLAESAGPATGWGSTVKAIAASPLLWIGALVGISVGILATAPDPALAAAPPFVSPELAAIDGELEVPRLDDRRHAVGRLGPIGAEPEDSVAEEPEVEEVIEESSDSSSVADPILVQGFVLDLDGQALADVAIASRNDPSTPLGWSGLDGRFELAVPGLGTGLLVGSDGWATVRTSTVEEENVRAEHVLVAARTVDVGGTVIDEAGAPLTAARVEVVASEAAFVHIGVPLNLGLPVPRESLSDETGRISLERAITGGGILLRTSLEGYEPDLREMPAEDTPELLVTLHRSTTPLVHLRGIVYHDTDEPAPGAIVSLGDHETVTDARGSFAMALCRIPHGACLKAVKEGYLPARMPDIASVVEEGRIEHMRLDLRLLLGGPASSISGNLYDESGEPLSGWLVSGSATAPGRDSADDTLNSMLGGPSASGSESLTSAPSDDDGGFEVGGLQGAGRYWLQAYHPETLLSLHAGPFAPGITDLALRLDENAWRDDLEGRVVGEDGCPLAGARITACLPVQSGDASDYLFGKSVYSDPLGYFAFGQVPRYWVEYRVEHPSSQTAYVSSGSGDDDDHGADDGVDFGLDASCYFQIVTVAGSFAPDSFIVLDGLGRELTIESLGNESQVGTIHAGRSLVHEVGSNARTLVLFRGPREMARCSLDLVPGEVVTVHPNLGDSGASGGSSAGSGRD